MITQSFLYNAIYFTYGLVLVKFYGVSADKVPLYGLAFAVGNLCGPLLLGAALRQRRPEADDLGHVHHLGRPARDQRLDVRQGPPRRDDADVLLDRDLLLRLRGASAAYLTVSETWPIEIRAEAIAVFFAIAQLFGALGPAFYGWLIGDGSDPTGLFIGYLVGGAIMVFGGIVELDLRDQGGGQVARGHHETDHGDRPGARGGARARVARRTRRRAWTPTT